METLRVDEGKTYIQCQHCGHYEEVTAKLFAKIIGGAVIGFGGYAWVGFLFAGCGFALPLCAAIVAGGTAVMAFSDEISAWMSTKYDCPDCGNRNWTTVTGKELDLSARFKWEQHQHYQTKVDLHDVKENLHKTQEDLHEAQKELRNSTSVSRYTADQLPSKVKELYCDAEDYIYMTYPWYHINEAKADLPYLQDAVARGVEIRFFYGIRPLNTSFKKDIQRLRNTVNAINYLKSNLPKEYVTFTPVNSHIKAMLCEKYTLEGSHNYMTYRPWDDDDRSELTNKLTGKEAVRSLKAVLLKQSAFDNIDEYL